MLGLHAELLHGELLPRLCFADLGALLLTCKATRDLVEGAPNSALLGAARHSLPSVHPLFSAASALQYLCDQGRIADAIAAGPQTWTVETAPSPPGPDLGPIVCAPSFTRAASHRASRLVVWELPSMLQLASIPVAAPGPAAEHTRIESECMWSDCSQVVACVMVCGQVALFNAATGQECVAQLGAQPSILPQFLPGQQALLLAGNLSTRLLVRLGSDDQLDCTEFPCGFFPYLSPLGAVAHTRRDNMVCIWQAEAGAVEVELPFMPANAAWAPCGTMLLCVAGTKEVWGDPSLAFVSVQGQVLACESMLLPGSGSTVWGRHGVLFGGPHHIHYYAVQPGPRLQLQHSVHLNMPLSGASRLSPEQRHLCFVANIHQDIQGFTVVVLLASPAEARAYDWADVQGRRLTGSGCHPTWLSDGSGVLLSPTYPRAGVGATQLIRFLRL